MYQALLLLVLLIFFKGYYESNKKKQKKKEDEKHLPEPITISAKLPQYKYDAIKALRRESYFRKQLHKFLPEEYLEILKTISVKDVRRFPMGTPGPRIFWWFRSLRSTLRKLRQRSYD